MIGSDAVVGLVSDSGVIEVNGYYLGGKSIEQITLNEELGVSNFTAIREDGLTNVSFTRPYQTGYNPILRDSENAILVAIGKSSKFKEHVAWTRAPILIHFQTGVPGGTVFTYPMIHGLLMYLAFGIILPAGVMVARYGKGFRLPHWAIIHKSLQTFGFLLVFVSTMFALSMVTAHFDTRYHAQIGITIFVICSIQVLIAVANPYIVNYFQPRQSFTTISLLIHQWVGRLLLPLAWFNIFLGLLEIKLEKLTEKALLYTHATIVALWIGSYVLAQLVLYHWTTFRDKKEEAGEEFPASQGLLSNVQTVPPEKDSSDSESSSDGIEIK